MAKALKTQPSLLSRAEPMVQAWLPTFIYMSDYRAFSGSAQLDQVQQRRGSKPTEEDKTLVMIGQDLKVVVLEDLFPVDFYTGLVEEVYAKQLAAAGVPKLALTGTDMLCKRVERVLEDQSIKFNKGSVAKMLRNRLSRMKAAADLPAQTQTRDAL